MFNQKKYSKIKNIILKISKQYKFLRKNNITKLCKQNSDVLYLVKKAQFSRMIANEKIKDLTNLCSYWLIWFISRKTL